MPADTNSGTGSRAGFFARLKERLLGPDLSPARTSPSADAQASASEPGPAAASPKPPRFRLGTALDWLVGRKFDEQTAEELETHLLGSDVSMAAAADMFVAVQGASSYTFAEATSGQDLPNWIGSHIRAFEFFGGVAEVVVPDNLKPAVTHPSYYEPDLNPTYRDLAEHYAIAIIPARPRKPREKAKAEVGVQVVQRWIVAALRKRKFFSLDEANQAIADLLVRLNQRPFRKRSGSRASLFAQLDQPALAPLPATRFQFGKWKTDLSVDLDYHVEIDHHHYSVPHALAQRKVDAHYTADTVEVFHRGVRVASHVRSYQPDHKTTVAEHMPKSHQKYLDRNPTRLIEEAQQIGPETGQLVQATLAAKRHPEMGYRSCLGMLRLAKDYPAERMEAAARRALRARTYSSKSLESILKNRLDQLPLSGSPPDSPPCPDHANIRGAEYFAAPLSHPLE